MAQEEADAVAALMAAASGDIRSEPAAENDEESPPGMLSCLEESYAEVACSLNSSVIYGTEKAFPCRLINMWSVVQQCLAAQPSQQRK